MSITNKYMNLQQILFIRCNKILKLSDDCLDKNNPKKDFKDLNDQQVVNLYTSKILRSLDVL